MSIHFFKKNKKNYKKTKTRQFQYINLPVYIYNNIVEKYTKELRTFNTFFFYKKNERKEIEPEAKKIL